MRTLANKILFILLACAVGFTGCGEKFEEVHDELALDYTRFNLSTDGGEFAFMVYFDGDWTISLDKEVEWMRLEKTSGTGVTPVHIYFDENHLFKRTVNMTISGGGVSKVIAIAQKPAVETPIFTFVENGIKLTKGSYRVKTIMKSNLSEIAIKSQLPTVSYELGGEGWISNFDVEKISDDYVVEGGTAVYNYYIKFDITANDSGEERAATLKYTLSDEEGNEYGNEVLVIQGTEEGKLIIKESIVRGCGAKEYSEEITGGLERFEEDIEIEVSENDLIDKAWIADGRLYYTLKENTGTERREAVITLKYAAGEITATITIIQTEAGIDSVYEISTPADLLAWNKDAKNWAADDYVVLLNDIDCTGAIDASKWNVNTNFTGTFDGNGKTINNFVLEENGPAAFLGRMTGNAIVKNLTFGNGCSFKANAVVSESGLTSARVYAAALVCEAREGAVIENVVNYGTVTGNHEGTANKGNYIGGICSSLQSTEVTISGCRNHGAITYAGTPLVWTNVGGVFGEITNADIEVKGCENHGHVSFSGDNSNGKSINLAGITGGTLFASFTDCTNFGTVEHKPANSGGGNINIGGFIGHHNQEASQLGTITNCANKGNLINNGVATSELHMGGFIGYMQQASSTISGFINYGDITNNKEVSSWCCLGGVVGLIKDLKENANTITSCENHGNIESKYGKNRVSIGGAVGFIDNSNTSVSNIKNSGKIILSGDAGSGVSLGGAVGRIQAVKTTGNNSITSCENSGEILFSGKSVNDLSMASGIGGILGVHAGAVNKVETKDANGKVTKTDYFHFKSVITIAGCSNSGKVEKTGAGSNGFHIGGVAGAINSNPQTAADNPEAVLSNCSNTASVHNNSGNAGGAWTYTGGIIGYQRCKTGEISGCTNSGAVTNSTQSTAGEGGIRVGGIAGGGDQSTFTNCANSGTITDDSASTHTELGGICGRGTPGTKTVATGCENTGDIVCQTTGTGKKFVGGIIARGTKPTEFTNCVSVSDVTVQIQDNAGILAGNVAAGGTVTGTSVGGSFNGTALDATNFTGYCFGTASPFKDTANITLAQ